MDFHFPAQRVWLCRLCVHISIVSTCLVLNYNFFGLSLINASNFKSLTSSYCDRDMHYANTNSHPCPFTCAHIHMCIHEYILNTCVTLQDTFKSCLSRYFGWSLMLSGARERTGLPGVVWSSHTGSAHHCLRQAWVASFVICRFYPCAFSNNCLQLWDEWMT